MFAVVGNGAFKAFAWASLGTCGCCRSICGESGAAPLGVDAVPAVALMVLRGGYHA